VQLRVENIGDPFDEDTFPLSETPEVDIYQLAEDLFIAANGDTALLSTINIVEKALTGNQDYATMKANKVQWKTMDDRLGVRIPLKTDASNMVATLEK